MFPDGASRKVAQTIVSAAHLELIKLSAEIRGYRETLTVQERTEFDCKFHPDRE
jgi:hypothetical protein